VSYKRGDIVWVKFPFSDAATSKLRPALVISNTKVNSTGDFLLMQVTTRLRNDNLSLLILKNNFSDKPLLRQSELRIHKIFILNQFLIESRITTVSNDFLKKINERLFQILS
jgi:mRNA interferase MazF